MKTFLQDLRLILFALVLPLSLFAEPAGQPPSVFVGIVIKNNDQTIPLFLRSIQKLDYDKKQITLQINLLNTSEAVKESVKTWVQANTEQYKEIALVDNTAIAKRKIGEAESNRFIAGIKDEYLIKTKMRDHHYCMIVNSDVFLEPKTLKILMQKKKPIVVPLLRPVGESASLFRNFFAAATDTGYFKDHADYYPIANREKLGTFNVACAHMAYLINAKFIDKLSFSDGFEHWEFISFSNNARKNHVKQFVCNEHEFGFFLHFDKALTLEEEKSFTLAGADFEMTPALLQAMMDPYTDRDASLKAYVDDFDFNNYTLFRVQNKELYYIENDIDPIKNATLKRGIGGNSPLQERFNKYVKPGTVVVEIGSSGGIHAMDFSTLVGQEGTVHLFEPEVKLFCEAAINMHLNQCKNVILHRSKASLDESGLNDVSLVKIDNAGFEREAIWRGLQTIKRDRPVLIVKLSDTPGRAECIEEIERLGYFSVNIDGIASLFLPEHLLNMDAANEGNSPSQNRSHLVRTKNLINKPVSVAWEGTFVDCGSLSNVNRCLTNPLSKNPNINLTRVGPNTLTPITAEIPELLEISKHVKPVAPAETEITVRHAWPPNWKAPAQGKWVIIQPWEFGSLPEEWVTGIKNVDEVWAPSHYVKREYVESGVPAEKVYIVPNGIDPEKFDPHANPYPLATKKKFKFLFLGGTIWRKGGDLLVSTYLRTFKPEDDVCLVIKDFGSKGCYAGQTHEKEILAAQANPANPEIVYMDQEMSVDDIAGLYSACDCLVYPYRGEGFALPVLEAMASGLPVIVTKGGPTDDFVTHECGWFIPSTEKKYPPNVGAMKLVGDSWLLEPDTDILSAQLKWIVSHPAEVKAKGIAASRHAKQNWTWQQGAAIAAERLEALSQK